MMVYYGSIWGLAKVQYLAKVTTNDREWSVVIRFTKIKIVKRVHTTVLSGSKENRQNFFFVFRRRITSFKLILSTVRP